MGQVTSGKVEKKETRDDHGTVMLSYVHKPGVRVNRAFVDEVVIGQEPLGRPSARIERVTELLLPLWINNEYSVTVEKRLLAVIQRGLSKETNSISSVKCFPTYVQKFPTGEETCKCLALDLGGTNLRCILVEMRGHQEPTMKETKAEVPQHIKTDWGRRKAV